MKEKCGEIGEENGAAEATEKTAIGGEAKVVAERRRQRTRQVIEIEKSFR